MIKYGEQIYVKRYTIPNFCSMSFLFIFLIYITFITLIISTILRNEFFYDKNDSYNHKGLIEFKNDLILTAVIDSQQYYYSSFPKSKTIIDNTIECEIQVQNIDNEKDGIIDKVNIIVDLILPSSNSQLYHANLIIFPEIQVMRFTRFKLKSPMEIGFHSMGSGIKIAKQVGYSKIIQSQKFMVTNVAHDYNYQSFESQLETLEYQPHKITEYFMDNQIRIAFNKEYESIVQQGSGNKVRFIIEVENREDEIIFQARFLEKIKEISVYLIYLIIFFEYLIKKIFTFIANYHIFDFKVTSNLPKDYEYIKTKQKIL